LGVFFHYDNLLVPNETLKLRALEELVIMYPTVLASVLPSTFIEEDKVTFVPAAETLYKVPVPVPFIANCKSHVPESTVI